MTRNYKAETSLRSLDYSPTVNPLMEPQTFRSKTRWVRTGKTQQLIDPTTGEVHGVSAVHQVEEKDDAEFVKVFEAGVAAMYSLTRTAQRVFQVILNEYQRTPMRQGFADYVEIFWADGGVNGKTLDMSSYTFNRGLRELIDKRFLWPKTPSLYWVNAALFFKGDRVMFIKEYRRRAAAVMDRGIEREAQEVEA